MQHYYFILGIPTRRGCTKRQLTKTNKQSDVP